MLPFDEQVLEVGHSEVRFQYRTKNMFKVGSIRAAVSLVFSRSVALRNAPTAMCVRSLYISTESPKANPQMMKFTVDQELLHPDYGLNWSFNKEDEGDEEKIPMFPIARDCFAIGGGNAVRFLFFGRQYMNVTISEDFSWNHVEPAVRKILMDYYAQKNPEFELEPPPYEPESDESEEMIADNTYWNVKHIELMRRDKAEKLKRKKW